MNFGLKFLQTFIREVHSQHLRNRRRSYDCRRTRIFGEFYEIDTIWASDIRSIAKLELIGMCIGTYSISDIRSISDSSSFGRKKMLQSPDSLPKHLPSDFVYKIDEKKN